MGSPLEIAAKLNALQRMSDLPLLVGADLETGAGYRARGGYFLPNGIDLGGAVLFPPEMAIGATRDTMLAYEQGRITALEGRALGVHIDFSPILDVNNNPANPVISTRSFGEDPALVATMGTAFIRGVQEHGMIATGKHFPGHGDTGTNSHLALPVVRVSRARLDSVELVPFNAAVKADVGAIMTFHGSMPALDSSGVPGTLSHNVLTSLLRDEMHFHGLVDLRRDGHAGRAQHVWLRCSAAQMAVAAGADVLLQPQDVATTIDAVVAGVGSGRYTEARLDESVRRILAIKARMGLRTSRVVGLDSARAIVGDSANAAVARLAAERSITLVRDSAHQLPLGRLNKRRPHSLGDLRPPRRPGRGTDVRRGAAEDVSGAASRVRGRRRDAPGFLHPTRDRRLGGRHSGELVRGAQLHGDDDQCAAALRGLHRGAAAPTGAPDRHGVREPVFPAADS